jgi:hypothetical protein
LGLQQSKNKVPNPEAKPISTTLGSAIQVIFGGCFFRLAPRSSRGAKSDIYSFAGPKPNDSATNICINSKDESFENGN